LVRRGHRTWVTQNWKEVGEESGKVKHLKVRYMSWVSSLQKLV
jgi:hypothetical protein